MESKKKIEKYMKLISMTDFVLEQNKIGMEIQSLTHQQSDRARRFYLISKYAQFLKQPLKLGMFVPCDEDGNILSKCTYLYNVYKNLSNDEKRDYKLRCENYQQAKERVLFEGFVYTDSQKYSYLNRIPLSVSPYGLKNERLQLTKLKEDNKYHTWLQLYTIEDLVQCNLELTQNAIKQIEL